MNFTLVAGFVAVIVRSGVGFPFPPHSDQEWGVVLAYLLPVLALVDQVRLEREKGVLRSGSSHRIAQKPPGAS